MSNLTDELWLPVSDPHLGRHYEVSNTGLVRRISTGHVLRPATDAKGYRRVTLQAEGHKRTFSVHRLVALAWVPGHGDGLQVRHLRGNQEGDAVDNLAWGTAQENCADRDAAGNNYNKSKTH